MDENLHKDNLEDFFKKGFEEGDLSSKDGDWDMPSDKVWDRLENELEDDRPQGIIIPWKYLTLAATILLLFVSFLYFQIHQKNDNLLSEINYQKEKNENLQSKIDSFQNATINNNTSNIESFTNKNQKAQTATSLDKDVPQAQKNTKFLKLENSQIGNASVSTSPSIFWLKEEEKEKHELISTANENLTTKVLNNETDLTNTKQETTATANLENKERKQANKDLMPLPSLAFSKLKEQQNISLSDKIFEPIKINNKKQTSFFVGTYIAPTKNRLTIVPKNRLQNRTIQKGNFTPQLGIKVGVQTPSNWRFSLGAQTQRSKYAFSKLLRIPYTKVGASLDDRGNRKNEYDIELNTFLGSTSTVLQVVENTDTQEIEEGDFIPFKLDAYAEKRSISVPIIAQKLFGEGPLQFSIKSGLIPTFVKTAVNVDGIETTDSRFKEARFERMTDKEDLRNFQNTILDWTVGLGLHYAFNEHLKLDIEPSYQRTFGSIFTNPELDARSIPNAVSVNIGLNYYF